MQGLLFQVIYSFWLRGSMLDNAVSLEFLLGCCMHPCWQDAAKSKLKVRPRVWKTICISQSGNILRKPFSWYVVGGVVSALAGVGARTSCSVEVGEGEAIWKIECDARAWFCM